MEKVRVKGKSLKCGHTVIVTSVDGVENETACWVCKAILTSTQPDQKPEQYKPSVDWRPSPPRRVEQ